MSSCFADDSTSMKYADNGVRISDLKNILERVAEVACLFDHDGISIRAINRHTYHLHYSTLSLHCGTCDISVFLSLDGLAAAC